MGQRTPSRIRGNHGKDRLNGTSLGVAGNVRIGIYKLAAIEYDVAKSVVSHRAKTTPTPEICHRRLCRFFPMPMKLARYLSECPRFKGVCLVTAKNLFGVVFLLGLLIATITVSAQFKFDQWTTDNGLPQNTVRRIIQTRDGYIWFTTLDGLVRFDGVRFTVFNKFNSKDLPTNRFVNLFADAEETMWISTEEHGVIRFRDGKFTNFTTADGLPSNRVFRVTVDLEGSLTALTSDGLARFDGTGFAKTEDERTSISRHVYAAQSGTIWELGRTSLASSRNGIRSAHALPEELTSHLREQHNIYLNTRLFEAPDGALWISVNPIEELRLKSKLFKFTNGQFREIVAENIPPRLISAMETDRNGDLWISSMVGGVCHLKSERFECFTPQDGLPTMNVSSIFRDREGTLWLATEDKGICQISEQFISPVSTAQGLTKKNVYVLFRDSIDAIWIGSLGALARFKDGVVTPVNFGESLPVPDVQSIAEINDGRILVGTRGAAYFFDKTRFDRPIGRIELPFGETMVFDIHQDRQGRIWLATSFGLFEGDGKDFRRLTVADGLPDDNVRIILENDDGSIWLGTLGGISLFRDGAFKNYDQRHGLAGNHVRSLYKDQNGALWIGTYDSGLSRFRDGKFTNYTTDNGLSSNGAFQISEDASGNFWISSNQGIYRVSRLQLEEFALGKRSVISATRFGKVDGMLNTEANGGGQPAGISFPDGKLWFPTQDGIAIVDTARIRANELAPPVVIEEARVNNQRIENLGSEIRLEPDEENLEIDYTGLSFIKPDQVQFRYKLDGLDEDWNEAKNRRTAFYPHLAPGEYVFHVTAANSDNIWNEQGASIRVVVLPPFYLNWWFIALSVVAFAAFVFWVNQRRVVAIKRKHAAQEEFSRRLLAAHESERRRVAAELHDSLGQTLAMIKNRAMFARQNTGDIDRAMQEFEQITEQSVEAINEVREISYNLRPYLLDRLGLTKALKSLFNKTAENSQLKIRAEIENIDKIFSGDEEMSLYRIIQESLNNINKHARAANVDIQIRRTETELFVGIKDDGCGFSAEANPAGAKTGGFGLLGMSERIKILGGTLKIDSAAGEGTSISLWIDLAERNRSRTNE